MKTWAKIATRLKATSIRQCMKDVTHREYLEWVDIFDEEWNEPDRHDYYQMQTALNVARGNAKNPRSLNLQQFKIPFKETIAVEHLDVDNMSEESMHKAVAQMPRAVAQPGDTVVRISRAELERRRKEAGVI